MRKQVDKKMTVTNKADSITVKQPGEAMGYASLAKTYPQPKTETNISSENQ
jgi:hypothetical protein